MLSNVTRIMLKVNMYTYLLILVTGLTLQLPVVSATVPTWPSSTDELEDIMFLNAGYRSKGFSQAVTPCSFSAQGPGRIAAAEWIRTAFHDMATANVYFGTGGLDASIVYELNSGENVGAAFNTTLITYVPFFGPRVSMSDIIATGMYTAVRSCGGPAIPIRSGRIDATKAGDVGVPQPQNAIGTFKNQFLRMGFNTSEMIAVTACGHSLGGVHASNFPQVVAPGTVSNDFGPMDSSDAVFDEKIASEYVVGNTTNPLAVGISRNSGRDSDNRVNLADNNVTIGAMADPVYFRNTCQSLLQRMIEVVPKGVKLSTNAIAPYEVKPYSLRLYLLDGGSNLIFSGEVRIRTTARPASTIWSVSLVYTDRVGGSDCGNCTIGSIVSGTASGFDDTFSFYKFSSVISAATSISSFKVVITSTTGTTETFDNNGSGFSVQDTILLQYPQSCLVSSTSLTITAAVRNTSSITPELTTIVRTPRNNIIVPFLNTTKLTMVPSTIGNVGSYNIYSISTTLDPALSPSARFNITLPGTTYAIDLDNTSSLPTICSALSPIPPATPIPSSNVTTPNYVYKACYTDSVTSRTFTAKSFSSQNMTYDSCSVFCSNYIYFGLEYGGECYCGSFLPGSNSSVATAQDTDCNMPCNGNGNQTCGNAARMSVFAQSANVTAPRNLAEVAGPDGSNVTYAYQRCYTDTQGDRTLTSARLDSDSMTVEKCGVFCANGGYVFMGVEYGSECYCGDNVGSSASSAGEERECGMVCSGDKGEVCGGYGRLSLYSTSGAKIEGGR